MARNKSDRSSERLSASRDVDELRVRGAKLKGEISSLVTGVSVSVSTTTISELEIVVHDPEFKLLRDGLFATGGAVDFDTFRQEISVLETRDGADGRGEIRMLCRSAAIGKLKRRRGSLVMNDVSPSEFVEAEAKAVGAKYVVQPSAKRNQVQRDTQKEGLGEAPSSWTTFVRLARELGYVVFEVGGTIYFAQPTWLWKRDDGKAAAVVTWRKGKDSTDALTVPSFRDQIEKAEQEGVTVSFQVPRQRLREFLPGQRVNFAFPYFGDKKYLVTGLQLDVAGLGPLEVTASNPVNPKPEPPQSKSKTSATGADGTPASRRLGDLLSQAGFSGEALRVACGVAIAESGGYSGGQPYVNAHALGDLSLQDAKWGPSVGVFQIRSLKHPDRWTGLDRMRVRSKLMFAPYNANLAFKMSNGGRDWSAWTAYTSGAYRDHVGKVDAIVRGWAAASPSGGDGGTPSTGAAGRGSALDFVNICLRQAGDAYIYGAEAALTDPDPDAFDCSELIQWAAHRTGCYMPDGSSAQMAYMRSKGTAIAVSTGLQLRGAILWIPGHVAVSLGGGRGTIEATNREYGVRVWGPGRSFSWQGAGRVPGMRY